MSVVRSKICGITRIDDALAAVAAGADAIGFVFYAKSPRAVSVTQARAIIAALPPFVTTVGLFEGFHRPYIKALRVKAGDDIAQACRVYQSASGILLDAYVEGVPGGTGEVFDWSLIPQGLSKPIILAGGLMPGNVAQAIAQVRPYAVDVSGGVEISKGIKDHDKIRAFMQAVRATA